MLILTFLSDKMGYINILRIYINGKDIITFIFNNCNCFRLFNIYKVENNIRDCEIKICLPFTYKLFISFSNLNLKVFFILSITRRQCRRFLIRPLVFYSKFLYVILHSGTWTIHRPTHWVWLRERITSDTVMA